MHTPLTQRLNRYARTSLTLVSFALGVASAFAQTATGHIQGRVLNASNGAYLTNARVAVVGTSLETFTNNFGDYRLEGVPAGVAKVSVFYTGLPERSVNVTVA